MGLAPIIGGLYGMLHDQLTYTISPEYYTKFKFYQFALMDMGDEAIFPHPRAEVSAVGFLATWWMGLPIGLILGLVGLIHANSKQMLRITMQSMGVTIVIAFLIGLIGLAYGKLDLSHTNVDWWFPANLIDKESFITVGSMHNFSYIGGCVGLIAGIMFSIRRRGKASKRPGMHEQRELIL